VRLSYVIKGFTYLHTHARSVILVSSEIMHWSERTRDSASKASVF